MREIIIISMIIPAVVLLSCNREQVNTSYNTDIKNFKELADNFTNPPQEFRTVPFWVWNTSVTKELIDRDLQDYKNHGFGGVFIHPRYGLLTDYLSQDWFDMVRYAVDKGKELGLYVWLYDENSFPSGFAGGHVPAEMPESWNEGMALRLEMQSVLQPVPGKEYKYILQRQQGAWTDITAKLDSCKGRTGEYLLCELLYYPKAKWYGGYSYVDLLHKGVTDKFIELTMKGYEKAIGADFGGWVPGIFTDEPHINPEQPGMVIKWTPDLFTAFREQWGYDLLPNIPSLVEETGNWTKIRHDYYATLLQMFIDRWAKPWYQYTEAKNLKWTGHYWEHGWPDPQHGSDHMAMYAWHQLPAIDMLFNIWSERPDQFGNTRAVKELSSVANQFGRKRTLSETYGASGWELSFRDMKRNGDWEYVMGVNLMNQHLSYMTLMGDRKHDFPQSFSFHAPYWDQYTQQADYYARLSLALSSGIQNNDILVIEPTTTMWMHFNPSERNEKMFALGQAFEDFLDMLEKHQVEYDLGCENIIRDRGKAAAGKLLINKCDYNMLVLPPGLENLDSYTVILLEKFLAGGGKLLSFVPAPAFVDGAASYTVSDLFDKYSEQCMVVAKNPEQAINEHLTAGDLQFDHPGSIQGMLLHHTRELTDGQLIFLVNSSLENIAGGTCTVKGRTVLSLDPFSGTICQYPSTSKDHQLSVAFSIEPAGSLLLFVTDRKSSFPEPPPVVQGWSPVDTTGNLEITPASDNVLVLDYCLLTMGNDLKNEYFFYSASDRIFKFHGFEDNPWVSSSQYRTNILDRDTFPAGKSGFRADFVFTVEKGTATEGLRAVVERPELYRVSVNGKEIKASEDEWWLDPVNGVFKIGELVKPGKNTISLVADPMSVHCELAPVFILGDFSLRSAAKGWVMGPTENLTTGSWLAQGRPFFSDAVTYKRTFEISDPARPFKIKLGKWNGMVAAVTVNGREAGIIFNNPWELDVTGLISPGANVVEVKIIGSLKNLLGPHHNVDLQGLVTPWSFKYAPPVQPAGEAYDLLDYGLFDDFTLLAGEADPS